MRRGNGLPGAQPVSEWGVEPKLWKVGQYGPGWLNSSRSILHGRQGCCLGHMKRADLSPAQACQVRPAAEAFSRITSQRADIGAASHRRFEPDLWSIAPDESESMDLNR